MRLVQASKLENVPQTVILYGIGNAQSLTVLPVLVRWELSVHTSHKLLTASIYSEICVAPSGKPDERSLEFSFLSRRRLGAAAAPRFSGAFVAYSGIPRLRPIIKLASTSRLSSKDWRRLKQKHDENGTNQWTLSGSCKPSMMSKETCSYTPSLICQV